MIAVDTKYATEQNTTLYRTRLGQDGAVTLQHMLMGSMSVQAMYTTKTCQ